MGITLRCFQGGFGATLPFKKYWILRGAENERGTLITGGTSVATLFVCKAF